MLKRLVDVARSYIQTGDGGRQADTDGRWRDLRRNGSRSYGDATQGGEDHGQSSRRQDSRTVPGGIPQQVIDDLAVFNLTPPSSLEAVRNARNREIKKYHSDKFVNDPEKLETSKEIMQIYNAAYDRLQAYYQKMPR